MTRVLVVSAIAGRNDALRRTLQSHHGYDPRVSVLGYTTRMRQLPSGADASVTTTAGSSIQEARTCGAPTVCYGFPVGHVRDNVNASVEHGIAQAAASPAELTRQLSAALREGRRQIPAFGRPETEPAQPLARAAG